MALTFGAVRRSWLTGLGSAMVFALLTLAYTWGLFNAWEWRVYDRRLLAARGAHPESDEIVILGKDEAAVGAAGGEWTRDHYVEALEHLAVCKPRVVGLDVMFRRATPIDKNRKPGTDNNLVLALKKVPAVLAAESMNREVTLPFPPFEAAAQGVGLFNLPVDEDGVVRKAYGDVPRDGEPPLPSLPLAMARVASPRLPDPGTVFFIRYRFAARELPYLSLKEFLGAGPYPCEAVHDKFVLIGPMQATEHDAHPTPAGHLHRYAEPGTPIASLPEAQRGDLHANMPGVEIHAQALLTLLHGDAPRRPAPLRQAIFTALIFAGLLWIHARQKRKLLLSLLFQLALIAGYLSLLGYLGQSLRLFMDLLYPGFALGGATFTLILRDATLESRRRKEMEQLFGRFVAPQVAKLMLAREGGIPLGGHRRLVTVMFSDIRGFTPLSESESAETVAALLNDYFTAMIEELFAEEGTFDKFIGDALMAFWNDPIEQPDHAARAVRCAVRMQKRLLKLNEEFKRTGRPTLQIGIGLNTGEAVVGNQGSRIQFSYTALGDNVNVAARLMGKAEPGEIVISTTTVAAIADFEGLYPGAKAGRFELKGKAEPVAAIVITVRAD